MNTEAAAHCCSEAVFKNQMQPLADALRTAVKGILFGTISSWADAKSINDNCFLSDLVNRLNSFFGLATSGLFFLSRCAKSSLARSGSLILLGSISLLHGSHSFAELVHEEFVEPVRTAAYILQQQHDCMFHPCLPYKCNDTTESWLTFLKLSMVCEISH